MEYLLYLVAFVAGSLFTIALDRTAARMRRSRDLKALDKRQQIERDLIRQGWQQPSADWLTQGSGLPKPPSFWNSRWSA